MLCNNTKQSKLYDFNRISNNFVYLVFVFAAEEIINYIVIDTFNI